MHTTEVKKYQKKVEIIPYLSECIFY